MSSRRRIYPMLTRTVLAAVLLLPSLQVLAADYTGPVKVLQQVLL